MFEIPRVTFGIIVLNGAPFIPYTLRTIYPYAHEIIVVEGAAPGAKNIATLEGHSRDNTLERLFQFQKQEDPENKIQIVTKEGFWEEKDEMSQQYANRATGDYLWQVDIDELYKPQDIEAILQMLQDDPTITAVSFPMLTFWGSLKYVVDGWYLRRGANIYHRLFKWGEGYQYVTHRPPTVHNAQGEDLRNLHWVDGDHMRYKGIYLYHYSLLLPKQVIEKCDYYAHSDWAQREKAVNWAQNSFLQLNNPYRVHNVYEYPSWLEAYTGEHPPEIQKLWSDIPEDDIRDMHDADALVDSFQYRLGRTLLKKWDAVDRIRLKIKRQFIRLKFKLAQIFRQKRSR